MITTSNLMKLPDGRSRWTETKEHVGFTVQRTVTATEWVEIERTDCFCCSCPMSTPSFDPHCRNHGFDGQRPCEIHNLNGKAGVAGKMPRSVQAENAANRSEAERGDRENERQD